MWNAIAVANGIWRRVPDRLVPRMYTRMNRDRRTRLATNRWADSPSPGQRVLPLLDPLLRCPASIVESHHSFGASRHVRHGEAHPGNSSGPMPLHLGYHTPSAVCRGVGARSIRHPSVRLAWQQWLCGAAKARRGAWVP